MRLDDRAGPRADRPTGSVHEPQPHKADEETARRERGRARREIAALRNRQALLSATVDLMKSLGGGWTPDQVTMKE